MRKILLIQGANMVWLGKREPEFYGTTTAADVQLLRLLRARTRDIDWAYGGGNAATRGPNPRSIRQIATFAWHSLPELGVWNGTGGEAEAER
jgi:hypothetical protein